MTSSQLDTINSIASMVIALIALIVSVVALVYTAKAYFLKSGAHIRGAYSICSSITCDDKYINSVILENLKDRAVIVFKIYLRLGHNYFVEVEDFEDAPLILRPFEVFNKDYDPIDLYSVGMGRILLNDLLGDESVKRQVVLSTSEGRYVVKERINYWDPITNFFQNHMTEIARPMRSTFKGKSYGSNAKYIVEFKTKDEKDEVIPIYPRDYEIRKFKHFKLTKEALESREALEEYLYEKVIDGTLNCADIAVYELESWRNEVYETENKRTITATYQNWFMYHIVGRIGTMYSNHRLKKQNKSLQSPKGPKPHAVRKERGAVPPPQSSPKA